MTTEATCIRLDFPVLRSLAIVGKPDTQNKRGVSTLKYPTEHGNAGIDGINYLHVMFISVGGRSKMPDTEAGMDQQDSYVGDESKN